MSKKLLHGLLVGLAAAGAALLILQAGWLEDWENATWSWRVRALAKPSASTAHIKLIFIDQSSLDWGAEENGLSWPWPRSVYAPILDFCRRSGARVVAFDMLYSEPGIGVEDDAQFGDAIARSRIYVGAFFMGSQAAQTSTWPPEVPLPLLNAHGLDAWLSPARAEFLTEPRATFPIPDVATNAARLASVKDVADRGGIFRRVTLFRLFDGKAVPSLALASYDVGGEGAGREITLGDRVIQVGERRIPADGLGRVLPRFRGKSGTHEVFTAAQIIQSELRLEAGEEPTVSTNALRDSYVLLGVSAPGLKDLKSTPVAGDYPGVEIHATVLDNLLEGDFLRDVRPWMLVLGTILPAVLAALLIVFSRKVWQAVVIMLVFLPLPFVRGFVAYQWGWWWPVVGPELAVLTALVGGVVLNYATEGRQKRFIKSAFKQYLGETVIDQIISDPSRLKLGGEKKELTMFFSDLEKFSSFSEKLEPPQLIELLNAYLSDVGQIIMEEGGYLDKYIGDAIVAFWNAPVEQPDHAARAVRAALKCQRRLIERQEDLSKMAAGMPVRMRIGLNTGDVVVGNMGSQERFNYTMLGDAANLASRLEGANKAFGTYFMMAEPTWKAAQGAVLGRQLGALRVVGRKTPVAVYEAMALAGETLPVWVARFEQALTLCRDRNWKAALDIFASIKEDAASAAYAKRLQPLVDGSETEWDGVWNLTEK